MATSVVLGPGDAISERTIETIGRETSRLVTSPDLDSSLAGERRMRCSLVGRLCRKHSMQKEAISYGQHHA